MDGEDQPVFLCEGAQPFQQSPGDEQQAPEPELENDHPAVDLQPVGGEAVGQEKAGPEGGEDDADIVRPGQVEGGDGDVPASDHRP